MLPLQGRRVQGDGVISVLRMLHTILHGTIFMRHGVRPCRSNLPCEAIELKDMQKDFCSILRRRKRSTVG